MELILTRWTDLKSIKDLGPLIQSPWRKKFFVPLGEERRLDWIEHEQLRPCCKDQRVHCAVDCGSIGCSALRPEAFTAPQLSDKAGEQQKLRERALPVGSVDYDRSFNVVGRRGAVTLLLAAGSALAQPLLAPIDAPGAVPAPPWRQVLLPQQSLPKTRFTPVQLDGERVLRIETQRGYGNLVHELTQPVGSAPMLSWRWRLDQPIAGAALQRKDGDDAALKVCVLMDAPLDGIPFIERQQLRLARLLNGEPLPSAVLCYVWDPALAAGSVLPNAYTRRVRWWVLQGAGTPLGVWREERRDLRADVQRAFGGELSALPRISAVLVGADADNTGGHGLAHLAGLALQ